MSHNNNYFGEVITSSLTTCTLQTWNWDIHPTFGAFVTVQDTHYTYAAIIHNIETTPLDASRIPVAHKKTHAELMAEHPHIFSLLKTTVHCTLLGIYNEHALSPITKPPCIHSFSSVASKREISCVVYTSLYIRTIMNSLEPSIADTVVYALIAQHKQYLTPQQFNALLKEYITYVDNDYRRIKNLNAHI